MKFNSKVLYSFAVGALSLGLAQGVHAQQQQNGLVNVGLSDVLNDLAIALDVNVGNIPVTVQAPIGVAANVCDVNANVLAEQVRNGGAECDAETTSQALNEIVQRQLVNQ
ncbi:MULTISPECIES: hypothetical protein [Cyanophyceae]|uniref:hypothetical protein n=1 Tax=Cyanophyceae TaxID=3028117 RepID=UPI001687C83D|nr:MULTISPECIES: hypothetical protein [Cyanophyceae]MBD1916903.1 hypothetical protein [Phormidium sp. FACHB-77]MBD2029909.1 hypothetical protein [Phormidium sp. FACHB-322]MBD2053105.1 hypothetical protein [Leptolyngbya sp. FACHB-60]